MCRMERKRDDVMEIEEVEVRISDSFVITVRNHKVYVYERAMIGHTVVVVDLDERAVEVVDFYTTKQLEVDPFHPDS